LTNLKANNVNSRARIAYMLKSNLNYKILYNYTQANKNIYLQYLSNKDIKERVLILISNAMQSELVILSHN